MTEAGEFFRDTLHADGRSILLPLPPNAGKSAMGAMMANLAGIGEPAEEGQSPLKALTLVPRRVARDQTLEAYRDFAPTIAAAPYNLQRSAAEQPPADSRVMTYKGILGLNDQDWNQLGSETDFLVLDEVHRAIGPNTSSRLRQLIHDYGPTVIAMSATPDFSEAHTACNTLGIERKLKRPVTPRDAIDLGISNGVRLFALYSGENVTFTSKRDTLTESDLAGLIENSPRNRLIVDTMHDMALAGRRGIVQCLPGGKSTHAQTIAYLARSREIMDERTRYPRKMRVQALGEFQSPDRNDEYIRRFKRGELDALTFTKYLTEAFDHPLGYLITSPTTSVVDMGQITGRGARLHDQLTYIFCIIDKCVASRGSKRLQTPFDVFGEECFTQGIVLNNRNNYREDRKATRGGRSNPPKEAGRRKLDDEFPSPSVRQALAEIPAGTLLDELLLVRREYDKVPEGYIPLKDLPCVREGRVTPEGARYALTPMTSDDGRPLFVSVRTGGLAQYTLLEANEILSDRYRDISAKVTRRDIDSFFMNENWPRPSFGVVTAGCKATGIDASRAKQSAQVFEPEDARRLLHHLIGTPLVDPETEVPLGDLGRAIGHASTFMHLLSRRYDFDQYLVGRRKGIPRDAYRIVSAIPVEQAFDLLSGIVQDSATLRQRLGSASLERIVQEVQANVRHEMWRRKLRARISREVVDRFIDQYIALRTEEHTKTAVADAAELLADIPAPLDPSYMLSGFGENWAAHALCAETDGDYFFSDSPAKTRHAKQICGKCAVKGDCLVFELGSNNASAYVAAGFTALEREQLDAPQLLSWLKRIRQPSS